MLSPSIKQSSNGQKLADTLKRCGIASSITEANKLAGDIRNTEKKVQTFFDQRKKEIHEDFIQKVHPNRFESQKPINNIRQQAVSQSQIINASQKKQDYKNDAIKGMIERAKNPSPLKIQIEFDTPKQNLEEQIQQTPVQETVIETKKIEPIIEVIPEIVKVEKKEEPVIVYESNFSHDEPFEQDYICKFIKNEKEEIPAEGKEETAVHTPEMPKSVITQEITKEVKHEEKPVLKSEVKVDLGNFFGSKNKTEPQVKPIETKNETTHIPNPEVQSQVSKPQAPAVDINNFFNFAKKGKV